MKRAVTIALALTVLLSWGAFAEEMTPAEVGKPAPEFELEALDGTVFKLSENRGKVVYLNIWATWCPPCVAEMPAIQQLAQAHPDDLVVVGASVDDGLEEVIDFVNANGYTYLIGMDTGYLLAGALFPTAYIPESVFIDPDGVVSSIEVQSMTYAQLEQRYQNALNRVGGND